MSDSFDPYYKWLAIPPEDHPPNHYRLLGLPNFESDADVITNAANQRIKHLRSLRSGRRSKLAQRILDEVTAAKRCLLDPSEKTAYDAQ